MEREVAEQSIRRFRELLIGGANPNKRRDLERLLTEEEACMAEIDRTGERE